MLKSSQDSFLRDVEAYHNSEAEYSSEQLYLSLQKYLPHISEMHRTVDAISCPFGENSTISSTQCKKAIIFLNKVRILMQEFNCALNPSQHLLSFFTEPSCRLLLIARILEEEATYLIVPIQSYRVNCEESSSKFALLQRKHIASTFRKLHSSLEDILIQITQYCNKTAIYNESQQHGISKNKAKTEVADSNFLQCMHYPSQLQKDDPSSCIEDDGSDRKSRNSLIFYLDDYRHRHNQTMT